MPIHGERGADFRTAGGMKQRIVPTLRAFLLQAGDEHHRSDGFSLTTVLPLKWKLRPDSNRLVQGLERGPMLIIKDPLERSRACAEDGSIHRYAYGNQHGSITGVTPLVSLIRSIIRRRNSCVTC